MKSAALMGIALACVVGLAGCGKANNQQASEQNAASTMSQSSARIGRSLDDTAITTKVKSELLAQKDLDSTAISVETKGGEVTLSGTVPPDQIARAETVARKVDGVREVINQLKAKSTS